MRLEPDERIRVTRGGGVVHDWFDPRALVSASPEAIETPAWALGAVWYNIFPERFDNARSENDHAWPAGTPVPWDQDWFHVSPDEFEASANRAIALPRVYGDDPDRSRPPLNDVVFERRYGGDLAGAQRRLDHIQNLGADAIWFCPVFSAESLHKYDATDHRHIDPHFGPSSDAASPLPTFSNDPGEWIWTPADRAFVDDFLPEAKDRGLRVILDGVWNHVGLAHPAFRDAMNRGKASPYDAWFDLTYDESGRAAGWRAWDGRNGRLPAFSQIDGDLAPGPRQHVFDVTNRWMDPDGNGDPGDGIDGWRLDVANEIGLAFWEDWRNHVRALNPDAFLLGELWFDGSDYFGGKAFDAQMNYPLAFLLLPWLSGIPNAAIAEELQNVLERNHPATQLAQMNLLASHDTARLVSLLAHPGLEYDQGAGMGAAGFDRSRPGPEAYERLELAFAVLTVLPGSPMVFAGDELGVWGGDDPENRKPLPWPDRTADPALVSLAEHTSESVGAWLRLRRDERFGPILRLGGTHLSLEDGLLVIDRDLDGDRVRLLANAGQIPLAHEFENVPARTARLFVSRAGGAWDEVNPPSEKP